jgi:acyl-CoA synthetase (AMP-forming)/AMP-acid ligase II
MIELTLGRSLRLAAERAGERTAIICGDVSMTHTELNRLGNQIGNGLLELGLKKGDRLGVVLPNCVDYLAIVYGAAKCGIALIFLNYRFTGRELTYQLASSGAKALIYGSEFRKAVAEARHELKELWTIGLDRADDGDIATLRDLAAASPEEPNVAVSERDILYLGYTSGTTGFPKGAIVTHRNRCLAYHYWAIEYGFHQSDTVLQAGPTHHSVQIGFTLAQLCLAGRAVVLPKFDAWDALSMMEAHKVTWSFMVPFMYNAILNVSGDERQRLDLSGLRFFISAASPLPTAVKEGILTAFPSVGLNEFYGATEAGIITNLAPCDQRRKIRSVGKPIFDTEAKILTDSGDEAPVGEVGLLYIKSPTVFDGYYGAPEKTAASFRGDWCTLGDLARRDEEGYLYIVDRAKDVIKSGGVNIFPAEIEEVLNLHPAVFEVAVVGVPDPTWGEVPHAIIVLRSEKAPSVEELLVHCRGSLASYKTPKSVEFRTELPRNPGGKVLKRELRAEFWKNEESSV